ncbi:Virus attachment protein p12 family protein [Clostridium cadaveris]|uniref:FeoB-associated Cys-rich membrane protein n=2 Tax=Clostridiaceae TaxID=31979 RepID=A0A1I2KWG0_9CLOT|nr:FeoB-associated Cys-rich membrane protein [Clostridium cadaveris]NWK11215.1 FeoB-associated Cys-rich membrane protein [Clostridium cadaveris]PWL53410.1 MAG: FeoB-associated Cys-rich membrane protein [Clostridium cadaveris]UFH66687.1 FeoB-associated Cys-rich membrane protein [Clostridium cadaveris]SFF70903.1 Virus attachment protein p12 family protein [Clostridium cadaveris]
MNLSTMVVGSVVLLIVASVIFKMVKDKKKGKSSCGCNCANCPSSGMCHSK